MWIQTADRLPPRVHGSNSNDVPVVWDDAGDNAYATAHYDYNKRAWIANGHRLTTVLFWYDLPPLPE